MLDECSTTELHPQPYFFFFRCYGNDASTVWASQLIFSQLFLEVKVCIFETAFQVHFCTLRYLCFTLQDTAQIQLRSSCVCLVEIQGLEYFITLTKEYQYCFFIFLCSESYVFKYFQDFVLSFPLRGNITLPTEWRLQLHPLVMTLTSHFSVHVISFLIPCCHWLFPSSYLCAH